MPRNSNRAPGRPALASSSIAANIARQIAAETDDGSELVRFVTAVFRDVNMPFADRQWALEWLADRCAGKAAATLEIQNHHTHTVKLSLEAYTDDELEEMERIHERAKQRTLTAPKVIDIP